MKMDKLNADASYLSPLEITELKNEIGTLIDLVKVANIDESDDDDEFACKICLTLVEGIMHACTTCELLLCDDCKTQHCKRGTQFVRNPGCRADFSESLNPRRSRIAENVVEKILKKQRK